MLILKFWRNYDIYYILSHMEKETPSLREIE
nr:MAG TPA: hypothetical protein [Caudoviricetes sp.]